MSEVFPRIVICVLKNNNNKEKSKVILISYSITTMNIYSLVLKQTEKLIYSWEVFKINLCTPIISIIVLENGKFILGKFNLI